jgi:hypothetical protein
MSGVENLEFDGASIDRAALNDSVEGRTIAAGYVAIVGEFVSTHVRPVLRRVAAGGGEPQLLVNGLAELMRRVADAIELPVEAVEEQR